MNISRHLEPSLIRLSMETRRNSDRDGGELSERQKRDEKESVLAELVGLLSTSEKIANPSKLLTEFVHRERKATTAIGDGIAIPHVRTYQTRELVIAVGRSEEGLEFDAPDDSPVRLFFAMAAPSYDDTLYLRVFKALGEVLQFDYFRERLLEVEDEFALIRAFREME